MTASVEYINKNMFKPINKMSFNHRIIQYLTGIYSIDDIVIFYTNYYKQSRRYYHWQVNFSSKDSSIIREVLGDFFYDVKEMIKNKKYSNSNISWHNNLVSSLVDKIENHLARIDKNEDESYDIYYTSIYYPSNMHYSRYIHLTKNL